MASFWRVRIFGRKNFRLRWTKEPYRGVILTVHGTFLPISTMLLLMLLHLLIIRVSSSFSLILNRLFSQVQQLETLIFATLSNPSEVAFFTGQNIFTIYWPEAQNWTKSKWQSIIISHFVQGFQSTQYRIRAMSRNGLFIFKVMIWVNFEPKN